MKWLKSTLWSIILLDVQIGGNLFGVKSIENRKLQTINVNMYFRICFVRGFFSLQMDISTLFQTCSDFILYSCIQIRADILYKDFFDYFGGNFCCFFRYTLSVPVQFSGADFELQSKINDRCVFILQNWNGTRSQCLFDLFSCRLNALYK